MVLCQLCVLLGTVVLLAGEAPAPFFQAFHALETPAQKVRHLQNWHTEMGAQNGLTPTSAGRFGTLLHFKLFSFVNDAGVLDCEALARNLSFGFTCLAEIDEPGYQMFNHVFEDLCPAQRAEVRARCGHSSPEGLP